MSDELYLKADEKIEKARGDIELLFKNGLNLDHKMDMLMTEQRLLKERVEEGVSKTAYKTYEMVNQIFGQIKDMAGENKIRDHKISYVEKTNEWIVRGFVIVIAASVVGAVILAILKWKT